MYFPIDSQWEHVHARDHAYQCNHCILTYRLTHLRVDVCVCSNGTRQRTHYYLVTRLGEARIDERALCHFGARCVERIAQSRDINCALHITHHVPL